MSFVVRKLSDPEVSQLQRSTGAEHTRGPYPKSQDLRSVSDVVKSTLKVYPPSDGVPKYSVLVEQANKSQATAFVLYESDSSQDVSAQRADALKSFEVIHKTLKPLIKDGVVMLSTYLLNLFDFEAELQDVIDRDKRKGEESPPPLAEKDDSDEEIEGLGQFKEFVEYRVEEAAMCTEEMVGAVAGGMTVAATAEGTSAAVGGVMGVVTAIKKKILKKSTELEAAFEDDDCDYYRGLLERGQSLSKPVEGSEDGSNYLHFAAEREEKKAHKFVRSAYNYISQLIQKSDPDDSYKIQDFHEALNAQNRNGFTPLMLAVRAQNFESALALLLAGADPDIADLVGTTPLHHAAQLGNLELVRLLVVFFANLVDVDTLLKKAGKSDSKDASLCASILEEMKKAAVSDESGTLDSISIPDADIPDDSTPDDSTFLLSLDGGSIKCVITIQILLHLAKRMKEIQDEKQLGNGDPVRMQSYFDYMAGTSAGSFIVLGLRYCNNITLEICRAAAFKVSQEVMSKSPTFDSEVMERNLKELVGGEDLTMTSSESEKQRVIITTVQGDKDPPVLHLLCNYARPPPETPKERRKSIRLTPSEREQEIPLDPDVKEILSGERKVWEAARASSAAPYYFEPFKKRLIDGGVMANNPTLDSLAEIFRQGEWEGKTVNIGLVLSIGTGVPIAKQLKDVGVHRPSGASNIMKSFMKVKSSLSGLGNLFQQLLSQSTRSDGQEVERADAWCKAMGAHYVRLSPELSRDYDFGETDNVTLTEMMYEGHIYALEQREKIDLVARLLLKRMRAQINSQKDNDSDSMPKYNCCIL